MSGLLSFLLFGALFFFMMRFGCGPHAGHGGHANHRHGSGSDGPIESGQQSLTAGIDPVCGMKVDAEVGYLKMFRGKSYRFCSRDCLDKFEAEPDRYAAQPGSGQGGAAAMKTGISLKAAGQATSLFLLITYALCVAFDLLVPRHAMYHSWLGLLPGFHWLTWRSFFLGLIESYGYGWFIALIWVPLYNVSLLGRRTS